VTVLVLFILAVIWAAVLLPPYLQNRSESRPADSISSFQHQLSVLERRANPGAPRSRPLPRPRYTGVGSYAPVSMRVSRTEIKKRRRDVLFTIAGAAGLTLLMAIALGGMVWGLQLVCDLLLLGYVYLLASANQRAIERTAKVRPMPVRRQAVRQPELLLRRSGS
jgi:hypothetical protein